ncbi:MAG: hypothetical protein GWN68_10160 [Gemmatimonadetes bacterium]|uniref:Lipoprotein n=1 Tax=Candidatus Kutchimonas denitrificans TaxID=3056748 RepID=A0AAE4ZAY4_9BACT|nr:hypothetical protein [Candidatus Kutchimonas denitrificans]NIU53425.1 hypothetical protein [Gemmatimonadota bacterium]
MDKVTRRLALTAIGGVLLLAFAGCAREDQNALIVSQADSVVAVAPLAEGSRVLPAGSGSIFFELLDFDLSNPDAFGRAGDKFGYGIQSNWYRFDGSDRNSATDIRLPVPSTSGGIAEDIHSGCRMGDSRWWGGAAGFDLWCPFDGLSPSTDYVVALVRYSVDQRGALDASEKLIFGTVAEPDSLVLLGGSPGGYPGEPCNFSANLAYQNGPDGTQNPFVLGTVTSTPLGVADFDCLVGYSTFWADWNGADGSGNPPIMPNRLDDGHGRSYDLPWYNYMEIYEGQIIPGPTDVPVIRLQLGVDLDASGNPIPNSFAPLPTEGLNLQETAVADAATSAPDSLFLTYDYLAALDGMTYKLWGMFDDGSIQALDFEYRAFDSGGDTVVAPSVVSSFNGGDLTHELRAAYPGDTTQIVQFFLTIDASDASQPSDAQPLWIEDAIPGVFRAGESKSSNTPPIIFGTFDLGASNMRPVEMTGTGGGGLFGAEYRYTYEHLRRPPAGYQYVGWLVGDTAVARLPDAAFTTPPREYAELTDADNDDTFDTISPLVTRTEIVEALSRACTEETVTAGPTCAGPFDLSRYDTFVLTLEPKDGTDVVGPTRVLEGVVPAR